MSEHISDLLDTALRRLAAGEHVEAILGDYPTRREELAPLLYAARELSPLRNQPRPIRTEMGLATFLDEARTMRSQTTIQRRRLRWLGSALGALPELWLKPSVRMAVGTVTAFAVLFSLLAGSFALGADSLPGQWLYPVKLAGEEIRISFILDQTARAEFHRAQMRKRTDEILRLAEGGGPIGAGTVERLNRALQASLVAAATADSAETPRLLAAIERTITEQEALLTALEASTASAETQERLDQVRLVLSQTRTVARAGRADVLTFFLDAKVGSFQIGWSAPESMHMDAPAPPVAPPQPSRAKNGTLERASSPAQRAGSVPDLDPRHLPGPSENLTHSRAPARAQRPASGFRSSLTITTTTLHARTDRHDSDEPADRTEPGETPKTKMPKPKKDRQPTQTSAPTTKPEPTETAEPTDAPRPAKNPEQTQRPQPTHPAKPAKTPKPKNTAKP